VDRLPYLTEKKVVGNIAGDRETHAEGKAEKVKNGWRCRGLVQQVGDLNQWA
jgi:hypothetical protein